MHDSSRAHEEKDKEKDKEKDEEKDEEKDTFNKMQKIHGDKTNVNLDCCLMHMQRGKG